MTSIITQIQSGASNELLDTLKVDMQEIYTSYNTQVASEIAARLFTSGFELGQCFLELVVDLKDIMVIRNKASFAETMAKWEEKILKKYPERGPFCIKALRLATPIIGLAFDGFGLYMSVKYFMGWDNLSDADRATAVIGFVQTVVMTARDVAALVNVLRGKDPASFDYKITCLKWNNKVGANDVGGRNISAKDANGEVKSALDHEKIEGIQNPKAETMSDKLAAKVGTSEVAGEVTKEFSLMETATSVIAIAANIASCVCMGLQIQADYDEDMPPSIIAMDVTSEVVTSLQVVSGIVEVGAMVLGVESIAIPGVGFIIAFAGIVLMFCEIFVHRPKPRDPVDKYLDDHLDGFFNPMKQRPSMTLTYNVTPSVSLNQQGSIVIHISNPQTSTLHFTSISIAIPAGTEDTQLFIAPSGIDTTVTSPKAPTTNLVTYTLNSDQAVFQVAGSPVPNNSDGALMARITPVGTATSAQLPSGGLTLTVTGSVNAKAGSVRVKVQESAADRGGTIPNRDFYAYL